MMRPLSFERHRFPASPVTVSVPGELLQGSDVPETDYRSFASSKRLVLVFPAVVEPTSAILMANRINRPNCRTIRSKPVGHDRVRSTVTFHHAPQRRQTRPAVPAFRDKHVKHFTFMIDRAPKVASLAIDTHDHLG